MAGGRDLGERVYRGTHFEVYRGWNGRREVARKVPVDGGANPASFEARATTGGPSTWWSLSFGTLGPISHDDDDLTSVEKLLLRRYDASAPVTSADLLENEAQTLERHGRAWGPELCSFEPDSKQPVLETAWCPAVPLDSLPREQARALLPALLPALWDALVDRLHGDLSPSNLLVSPDGPRAFLIDPAAFVLREEVRVRWDRERVVSRPRHHRGPATRCSRRGTPRRVPSPPGPGSTIMSTTS